MKQKMIILMLAMLASPTFSSGQYFQGLYDVDSSQDWGYDIFIKPDGSLLIYGTSLLPVPYEWALSNIQITADGSSVINKNILTFEKITLILGNAGATTILPGGCYLSPITSYLFYGGNQRSWAGLIKYNAEGDTIFLKTYTDTPVYYDIMFTCAVMPNGGYLAGGQRNFYGTAIAPGYIMRTDSLGDTIWSHTYLYVSSQPVQINNIIPLADGRIVVDAVTGASSWYMLLDSMGNIIRDTLYTVGFQGSFLYPDMNGGFISIGDLDSLLNTNPDDYSNFPSYIAHMDSNFRMTWIKVFPFSLDSGNRQAALVKQLQDSSYIVLGDMWPNEIGYLGWAAKVNRDGEQVWSNTYISDTNNFAHFRGMVEKPDGSLVFVGETFNDTLPAWQQGYDVWLVGTDSNGCYNPFCAALGVKPLPTPKGEFSLYPNPTGGNFAVTAPQAGNISICNIQGQQVAAYTITAGETSLRLPGGLAAGVYFVRYISEQSNNVPVVTRLIYAP